MFALPRAHSCLVLLLPNKYHWVSLVPAFRTWRSVEMIIRLLRPSIRAQAQGTNTESSHTLKWLTSEGPWALVKAQSGVQYACPLCNTASYYSLLVVFTEDRSIIGWSNERVGDAH